MTTDEMRALGIAASKYTDAQLEIAIHAAEADDRKLVAQQQSITNRLYVLRNVYYSRHPEDEEGTADDEV